MKIRIEATVEIHEDYIEAALERMAANDRSMLRDAVRAEAIEYVLEHLDGGNVKARLVGEEWPW